MPPKLTAVAPVKLLPFIVTETPAPADWGLKEDITGAGIKVNPAKLAFPDGAVTETLPEVPLPTTASIVVGDTTVKEVAGVPPKLTSVTPDKEVPVMVTVVPIPPVVGAKEES